MWVQPPIPPVATYFFWSLLMVKPFSEPPMAFSTASSSGRDSVEDVDVEARIRHLGDFTPTETTTAVDDDEVAGSSSIEATLTSTGFEASILSSWKVNWNRLKKGL